MDEKGYPDPKISVSQNQAGRHFQRGILVFFGVVSTASPKTGELVTGKGKNLSKNRGFWAKMTLFFSRIWRLK